MSNIMIEAGNIVANLIAKESVTIDKVRPLGTKYSVQYTGVNTNQRGSRILTTEEMEALTVLTTEGTFNFTGDPQKCVLFAEAERIHSAYQFDPLFAINCSIVDALPHQVEAVYKFLLPQPRIRFLIADDTGAGKTIMTGLLLKEMFLRDAIRRVLIVSPGGLTKQWQEDEMATRFNLNFKLVNRSVFSSEPDVFRQNDRVVASIDFICRDDVLKVVSQTSWDMIVFDEAHKLSAYEYGLKVYKSKRYDAAHALSKTCDHILLLTATPHRGRPDSFKRLMQLLDEDIFATDNLTSERVKEMSREGINKFFIRRLKEDMRDWQQQPLYKARHTKTTSYQLTDEEKNLYDAVTDYLTKKKGEAAQARNIHVSLALQVMQRRLVSSIYAIRNTLFRRWQALAGLVDLLTRNPSLWKQRAQLDGLDVDTLDDFDELDDQERDDLDNLMADPRRFKLFTTAKSPAEIAEEAEQVKQLYDMANSLYTRQAEEQKYIELKKLLSSQGIIDGEKLVIFTEHKDTLLYLQERLSNTGYSVGTIHGGMSVDERREQQSAFKAGKAQILICTDAAGEGINLQFCRLLINWDIPWNPNRLEQRMGRIHRYGQQSDVMVFNMVAANTREGEVLKRLLEKLDVIREQLGDDRVYDVIQDVLKGVSLDSIIASVMNGQQSELDRFIDRSDEDLAKLFRNSINEQTQSIAHSQVDFPLAHQLKEQSDERRLQPIYIRRFFEKAFTFLGGTYQEEQPDIFRITQVPDTLTRYMQEHYRLASDNVVRQFFFFDKNKYLAYQGTSPQYGSAHYINPGNALFDSLVEVVRDAFREEMLRGTVLVSPEDKQPFFAYFVKNIITNSRTDYQGNDTVADELLSLVCRDADGQFSQTSPAKLIDLCPPTTFAKEVTPPQPATNDEIIEWAFEHQTEPLRAAAQQRVDDDARSRRAYLEEAFTQVIADISAEINELQGRLLLADLSERHTQQLQEREARLQTLKLSKQQRLAQMEQEQHLDATEPQVMGCIYVVPLTQMEYTHTFGMSRDDNVEQKAMEVTMAYERSQGRTPVDVSKENIGYDVRSTAPDGTKRYIEVKGRAGTDGVMLSENEMNRLEQLATKAWLYIVTDCHTDHPQLHIINNPAHNAEFQKRVKGVQYFLPLEEWRKAAEQHPAE